MHYSLKVIKQIPSGMFKQHRKYKTYTCSQTTNIAVIDHTKFSHTLYLIFWTEYVTGE